MYTVHYATAYLRSCGSFNRLNVNCRMVHIHFHNIWLHLSDDPLWWKININMNYVCLCSLYFCFYFVYINSLMLWSHNLELWEFVAIYYSYFLLIRSDCWIFSFLTNFYLNIKWPFPHCCNSVILKRWNATECGHSRRLLSHQTRQMRF